MGSHERVSIMLIDEVFPFPSHSTLRYLKKKLYVPPENTMIIMDHWSEGAYCFSPSGFIIHKTPSNSFGEADLKAPYWVSQLARDDIPNHTIMVKSTDSDFTMVPVHVLARSL